MSDANSQRLLGLISPLVLLLIWEVLGQLEFIDTRFFPPPSAIIGRLVEMTRSGEVFVHLQASLMRLGIGFLVGGVPALVLGIAMGLSRPLRTIFDPLISATYPIPKSAILPLMLLIFGLGEESKIALVALGVFYPVVINTVTGVTTIPPIYMDVGKAFRADYFLMFRTVALPGALPSIMSGIKLGVGMGLILIAIAEMVAAQSGIGYMIWNAWQVLSVETMYVGLLLIAVLGYMFTQVLDEVERLVIPWRKGQ